MADDKDTKRDRSSELKEIRDQFDSDLEDWSGARTARATDMRALAGDPWKPDERQAREDAGRPCLTFDELTQHVNVVVNEFRANPLSVAFAPGPPMNVGLEVIKATEDAAQVYADAYREMGYRCNETEVFTTAAENAVQGGYGFGRLISEFIPGTFDQRLALKAVPDPNTIVPNWDFQSPDLCDMRRCFVLEHRPIKEFKQDFPTAKIRDFSGYLTDTEYAKWVQEDQILLAEAWKIRQVPVKLLLVQLPAVPPPPSQYGFRQPQARPPVTIKMEQWAQMPEGSRVIREREDYEPKVIKQVVNGVEILQETTWPGPYIPIFGCMGRILYLEEGTGETKGSGRTQRLLLSSVRLALEPFMAYCYYRTCEIETVGMITRNPYWAYAGQVTPDQQREIAKSMHEPVAILEANAKTPETGMEILPLPIRNPQAADLQGFALGAEEARRGVLSALGESALPTSAQRQNEKSKVALDKIEQSRQKGTYHFFDHYKMMVRHVGRLFEAAFDTFHDTAREIPTRTGDDTAESVRINDPTSKDAIDVRGSYMVTVSTGPNVDSTRDAASEFADNLLGSEALMTLAGPQKAQKLAALAIKLKVKQTGIGAIGEEIVGIFDPPEPGEQLTPEQLQQQNQELMGHLQQAKQLLEQAAKEREAEFAKQQAKYQGEEKIEAMRLDFEMRKLEKQLAAEIEKARISAAKQSADLQAEAVEERIALGTSLAHETAEGARDRVHDMNMAEMEHAHAIEQGDQAHQQALEQGAQGVQGQIAVQAAAPTEESA